MDNEYADEARERWGHTDAYRQSQQRTTNYTRDDWQRIQAEGEQLNVALASAQARGVPADSAEAIRLAQRHREYITRHFYDCPPEIHRSLGDMYVADPRFTATYEAVAPGLAEYLRDAIHANADRPQ